MLEDVGYLVYHPGYLLLQYLFHLGNKKAGIDAPAHISYINEGNVSGEDATMQYLTYFKSMLQDVPLQENSIIRLWDATTLIAVFSLNLTEQNRIALVIVGSPFDTCPPVLQWPFVKNLSNINLSLINSVSKYKPDHLSPVDSIQNFPSTIPIGFITSEKRYYSAQINETNRYFRTKRSL